MKSLVPDLRTIRLFAAPRLFAVVFAVGLVGLLVWALSPGMAHEGHDLAPAETAIVGKGSPRLALNTENYELVAILSGLRLSIYLDRFDDNAPVTNAAIAVTINDETVPATPASDGTYTLTSGRFGAGGVFEFVFDVKAPEADDLLIGKLSLPQPVTASIAANGPISWYGQALLYLRHGTQDHLLLLTLTLLAGLALGIGLHAGRSRVLHCALIASALALASGHVVRAHEGHDLVAGESAAPAPGDAAKRLPDGKVFVPKPTQRILDVRTVRARPESLPKAVTLLGRIITDPNRSGLVQSITGGRVVAPEKGLPRIGQKIAKGDILATIEPPMAMADRTTIAERIGEIEQQIAVAEAKLRRMRSMAERQVVPQALVVETQAELDGLYRRRDSVRETRVAPEILRAPIDGLVATAHVVAGQVVQAQDVLFQIIDPNSLWVEAYEYGDADPAALTHATAAAGGSGGLKLSFEGSSRTLQQQATVMQFSIVDPPSSIRVGQPVTVTAQGGETANGIIVDRDAVVRGSNGEIVVWRHVDPEYFEPRPVRIEPFDAAHSLIVAGIGEGERIVVRGAELINQIR